MTATTLLFIIMLFTGGAAVTLFALSLVQAVLAYKVYRALRRYGDRHE